MEAASQVIANPRLRQRPERPPSNRWRRVALRRPLLAAAALACALAPGAAWSRDLQAAIAEGDQHYAAARLADAVHAYTEALQAAPADVAALCRLARAESELGQTQKGDEQRRTWASAVAHARDAVRNAPEAGEPHMRLAVALGRQALREGPRTKLALAREIKSEVDRALALDAKLGLAWHVLAVWNVEVASLNAFERLGARTMGGVPKGASYENADNAFQKAITLEPAYVNHRLEYGRFLNNRRKFDDARRELAKAIALPATSSALDVRYQADARELLEKLHR